MSQVTATPEALNRFARGRLPLARGGVALGVCAVVAGALGVRTFPSVGGQGLGWPITALACCVIMLAVCIVHLIAWQHAARAWRRDAAATLPRLTRASYLAHVIAYVAVLLGMWATMTAMVRATFASAAGWLFAVALLALLAAQLLGGINHLRRSGPAGTPPTHVRRLNALADARRTRAE